MKEETGGLAGEACVGFQSNTIITYYINLKNEMLKIYSKFLAFYVSDRVIVNLIDLKKKNFAMHYYYLLFVHHAGVVGFLNT